LVVQGKHPPKKRGGKAEEVRNKARTLGNGETLVVKRRPNLVRQEKRGTGVRGVGGLSKKKNKSVQKRITKRGRIRDTGVRLKKRNQWPKEG